MGMPKENLSDPSLEDVNKIVLFKFPPALDCKITTYLHFTTSHYAPPTVQQF